MIATLRVSQGNVKYVSQYCLVICYIACWLKKCHFKFEGMNISFKANSDMEHITVVLYRKVSMYH